MAPPGGSQTGPHALPSLALPNSVTLIHNDGNLACCCKRNIEMTPLCKIEVTLPRVLGSREVCLGGVVDEQTGVQPA